MSGFLCLARKTLTEGAALNPVGYKIGLEIIVKCNCRRVSEVPIRFSNRQVGESKLSLTEQLQYVRHLRRLLMFKYPSWSSWLQFLAVGGSGTVVNLGALTALVLVGAGDVLAIAGGIAVGFLWHFALNRRFTFGRARQRSIDGQFAGFAAGSAFGLVTNAGVSLLFRYEFPALPIQFAALAGILAGMGSNYAASRYPVFHKRRESER